MFQKHNHHITQEVADQLNNCGRYLSVEVYRAADRRDCSLNGVTNQFQTLYVPVTDGHITLDRIANPAQILKVIPSCMMSCGPRFASGSDTMTHHVMFGGNFVYTCDSRFSAIYGHGPVSVHDRFESYNN